MAVHAVPQDVEADDQVIGFLSLKQLIFTIIGFGFAYLTFFFFTKVHPIAAIIWIPFTLFFFVLGLYRRKDQPAEIFLASALGFYLKPKVRIWSQDGYEERIHITAPPVIEKQYTKDFTGEEAVGRLSQLSLMMDSRGWASKRIGDWQNPNLAVSAGSDRIVGMKDVAATQGIDPAKYTQPADQYDENSLVGQDFEQRIEQNISAVREDAVRTMQNAQQEVQTPTTATSTVSSAQDEQAAAAIIAAHKHDDIPSIREKVIAPLQEEAVVAPNQEPALEQTAPQAPPNEQPVTAVAETPPPAPLQAESREVGVAHETEDGSVEISLH